MKHIPSLRRRMRSERGAVTFLFAGGLIVFLGFTALAVDMGMLYSAQTQALRAAESGALAGAGFLIRNPGQFVVARDTAEAFAERHEVMGGPVDIDPAVDVEFEGDTLVRVFVERSAARPALGGPVATFFARVLGIANADVKVKAAAIIAPGSAVEQCLFPFIPPDAWNDAGTRSIDIYFNDFDDAPTYDAADGDLYQAPDEPCSLDPQFCWNAYTGWGSEADDQGRYFVARLPTPLKAAAGWWHVLNAPPTTAGTGGGASNIRAAVRGVCDEPYSLSRGEDVYVQTGNMESVAHELEDLMEEIHQPASESDAIACYRGDSAACGDGVRRRTMALYNPNSPPREQGGGGGGGGGGKGGGGKGGGGGGDHVTPVGNFAEVWLAGFCDSLASEPACAALDPDDRDEAFAVMYLGPTTSYAAGNTTGGSGNPGSLALRLVE